MEDEGKLDTLAAAPPASLTPANSIDDALMAADLKARMFGRDSQLTVGRFIVRHKIGEGGMGMVYAAHDRELDRPVALKILRPQTDRTARLMREARALAKLNHPNVVTVHDVGEVGGRMYIAMELVEGESLRTWIHSARDWREILEAYGQAAAGLHAAHTMGIVHRDFKPDNVIMGHDRRVRVLDFGLARAAGGDEAIPTGSVATGDRLTQTGQLKGTPACMAPEQIAGGPVDPRCDQFALCIALYEALSGHRPFRGDTVKAIVTATLAGDVEEVPEDTPVPPSVWAVLRRGLAARPDERFDDVEALAQALAAAAGARDPRNRGRTTVRWAFGATAIALGALTLWSLRDDPAPAAENSSNEPVESAATGSSGYSSPPGCSPFRSPNLDPQLRAKRLRYLNRMIAPLTDEDPRLPESLLWVAELELQAGALSNACGALDRLHALGSDSPSGQTGACWRSRYCAAAQVDCSPGFHVDGMRGCVPVESCELNRDADLEAQVGGACDRQDAACCEMEQKLRHAEFINAQREGSDDLATSLARFVDASEAACELGHASICGYLGQLLDDGNSDVADSPSHAGELLQRACTWGHKPSCR